MEEWSAGACRRPHVWSHWTEGLHPDYRDLAREVQVADEVKLHKYAAHLLSSQALALNLFLLLREGARKALSERVSRTVETRLLVEEVRFERVPPGALLEELEGDRPGEDEPATTVDVVLWSRLKGDRTKILGPERLPQITAVPAAQVDKRERALEFCRIPFEDIRGIKCQPIVIYYKLTTPSKQDTTAYQAGLCDGQPSGSPAGGA